MFSIFRINHNNMLDTHKKLMFLAIAILFMSAITHSAIVQSTPKASIASVSKKVSVDVPIKFNGNFTSDIKIKGQVSF
jgi:hypothetical protein